MLKRRVIPVLLLRGDRCVKGTHFASYRDTGNPVTAARVYNAQNADELMFIDIDATHEGRPTMLDVVERVSKECFMPFTVGGAIKNVDDIRRALHAGADKVLITTAAVENPTFIAEAAEVFGSQCVVAGIDVRKEGDRYVVVTHSGRTPVDVDLVAHVKRLDELGAGELLVNAIHRDGTMEGYDLELVAKVAKLTTKPVIACGGAGTYPHLIAAFEAGAHAVSCASLFHFADNNPIRVRAFLKNAGYPMKNV
ncbi:MAG: imidazole glycerol phosphate synthase subunit HisF [Deltaproteobacteria bacterium]|nr:imidazole glycerol phosphate synthase subunit HisF [Deltaproteobacteria bacterium]